MPVRFPHLDMLRRLESGKAIRISKFVLIAFTFMMMLLTSCSSADDIDPAVLLAEVAKNYQEMDTFESEGTFTMDMDTKNMKMITETTFTMRLKKPDLYLITWIQKIPMGGMEMPGAVWHDGTQRGLYMGALNTWTVMKDDNKALAMATGISGGAANMIPSMFLPGLDPLGDPFAGLIDPEIEKPETIGEVECYVVSASSAISKWEKYWISKKDKLIVKFSRSLETPDGKPLEVPVMSDDDIEETLREMGEEVTEASKKRMRDTMDQSRTSMATMNLKGMTSEHHEKIASPDLTPADFKYELPEDAKQKDSLLGA